MVSHIYRKKKVCARHIASLSYCETHSTDRNLTNIKFVAMLKGQMKHKNFPACSCTRVINSSPIYS